MPFAVGDEQDSLAHLLVVGETARCQFDGGGDVGALQGHCVRVERIKQHFHGSVVLRDGQLGISLAGKDAEGHFIVLHLIHEVRHEHLCPFEAVGADVACQHGVGHVEHHRHLYAVFLFRLLAKSELWTCEGGNDGSEGEQKQAELDVRADAGAVFGHSFHQFFVAEKAAAAVGAPRAPYIYEYHGGQNAHQVEIFRILKAEHIVCLRSGRGGAPGNYCY